MASYFHLSFGIVKRSVGSKSTAKAAYNAGVRIADNDTGQVFDFRRKGGVDHTELLAPASAPAWADDRSKLWNAVEAAERRKDAQLARNVTAALPRLLTLDQQVELVRTFAERFVGMGMVVDFAIHDTAGHNPHAHLLMTLRDIGPDGFGKKNRSWNDRKLVPEWREAWADAVNEALERAGHDERVDHRSLADQGIERVASVHMGPNVVAMERKGIRTERGDLNRAAADLNAQVIDLEAERQRRADALADAQRALAVGQMPIRELIDAVDGLRLAIPRRAAARPAVRKAEQSTAEALVEQQRLERAARAATEALAAWRAQHWLRVRLHERAGLLRLHSPELEALTVRQQAAMADAEQARRRTQDLAEVAARELGRATEQETSEVEDGSEMTLYQAELASRVAAWEAEQAVQPELEPPPEPDDEPEPEPPRRSAGPGMGM